MKNLKEQTFLKFTDSSNIDRKGMGLLPFLHSSAGILSFILTLLLSMLFTFIVIRNITRISFKDIRNVGSLMDILVTQMRYDYYGSSGNKIEYLGRELPRIFNVLESLINKITFIKKMKLLSCVFDGNTITITGQNWSVKRLIKKISKYSV